MSTQIQAYNTDPTPCPMLQSDSLAIAQASLLFYSHHYKNLKCKIIDKSTSMVLCSKLINNCIQTNFSINRDLQDFMIQLYSNNAQVGIFGFTYEDLQKVIGQGTDNQRQDHVRKRKYIKFKKENDCCSLYFTIQVKDIAGLDDANSHQIYLYEDYVRNLANKLYKKLQKKAILRIKNIEKCKLEDKRLSLLERVDANQLSRLASKNSQNSKQKEKVLMSTATFNRQPHLAQSWIYGWQQSSEHQPRGNSSQSHCQRKKQYKLKKIQQRARKLFHKQIMQRQQQSSWSDPIIPEVPTASRLCPNIRLISQGIVFPTRVQSESFEEQCIRKNGLIYGQIYDNKSANLRNSYDSKLFEPQYIKAGNPFNQANLNKSYQPIRSCKNKTTTNAKKTYTQFLTKTTKFIQNGNDNSYNYQPLIRSSQQPLKRKALVFKKVPPPNSYCKDNPPQNRRINSQQKQKPKLIASRSYVRTANGVR